MRNRVLNPPRDARETKHEPVKTSATYVLRSEPPLFDIGAWQARLAELRSDDPSEHRDTLIEDAEAYIRAIGGTTENPPADGS